MKVVITGASKGIGRAVAEHFARRGADLFLCSRQMDKTLSWQNELMKRHGCSVASHNADVSDADQVAGLASRILEAFDGIDVLVNNAGQFVPGSIHDEPEGRLEHMLDVNLLSAYRLTRLLLPRMIGQRRGHIFNICSVAALGAYPDGGSYSISKWALLGFSRNLREELKTHGIKVTAVHPGATMSGSWEGYPIDPDRIMTADDIATLIVASTDLSPQACVEDILVRPQLGDL